MKMSAIRKEISLQSPDHAHKLEVIANIAHDTLANTALPPMTEHTFKHALRVETRAASLLEASNGIAKFNWYELYLLVLVCWFHDSGLVFISEGEDPWEVRLQHGPRCRRYLNTFLGEHLSNFERDLVADISMTHLKSTVTSLPSIRRVELGDEADSIAIRPQNIASILRIADASDISKTRVSWRVAKHFTMNNESRQHWERHLEINSVCWSSGEQPAFLTVDATYASYESRSFLIAAVELLDEELNLANPLLSNQGILIHRKCTREFQERTPDSIQRWTVLPHTVYKLLTEEMYDSATIHVRELIQNGLDAIKLRRRIEQKSPNPEICIKIGTDGGSIDEPARILVIKDNGIGMDADDICERLIKVGATVRDSELVKRLDASNVARDELIARFGVGFVTVFAIAAKVNIITKKPEMSPIRVSLEGSAKESSDFSTKDVIIKTELNAIDIGSKVTVTYREHLLASEIYEAIGKHIRAWDQYKTAIRVTVCKKSEVENIDNTLHWKCLQRDRSINPGDFIIEDNSGNFTVLQDGILIEKNAKDVLPDELQGSISGCVNAESGTLDLVSSRNSFRRNNRTLAWFRRNLDRELLSIQQKLLDTSNTININRSPSGESPALRALLDWSFSKRRDNSWLIDREKEIIPHLHWRGVGFYKENISLIELISEIIKLKSKVLLVSAGGPRTVYPVAECSTMTLYASPQLPYQSTCGVLDDDTLLLEADRINEKDDELYGEKVLTSILKRRNISFEVMHNPKGLADFQFKKTRSSHELTWLRWLFKEAGDTEIWVNEMDMDDFAIVERSNEDLRAVVNLDSPTITPLINRLKYERESMSRKECAMARAALLLAGMKFDEALDEMMSLFE